ncbi:MAG: hypothetical protein QF492_09535 [Candidatus Krumholzibacteria bacterium]|nr:hypothetical protein [Candidatus Krumholzibacteria bacterium]MDP6796954.1 hypothetical protein [Candidatus Krumholzibacteria bacterium]MDP7021966.1 hypothetical protein [Candidatus Krumholzibacteria bacterium]
MKDRSGMFVVEILDFEDKGAHWELPLEFVGRCQFSEGSVEASKDDLALYAETILRLDQPLEIQADPKHQASSEVNITSLRKGVGEWLEAESKFLASGASLDFSSRTGSLTLCGDLKRFMMSKDLWDLEEAFAIQFVSNPYSGELVKGHRIVLAELGLVSFEGKQVRDPGLFDGLWSKERREDHILYRLAFVRELYERLGHTVVALYRGYSCPGQPKVRRNDSFISTTCSLEVAMDHFNNRDQSSTGVLLRQLVPIERIFMSFLETVQMNQQYKEAEAVLFCENSNMVF